MKNWKGILVIVLVGVVVALAAEYAKRKVFNP